MTRVEDIGALFEFAREISPTILYFEDVDLYALDREEEGNRSAILGEILNQMDGIVDNDSVITVMTTNYAHKLEKALKDRPGRFDCHIKFDVPKKKIKIKLYKHLLKDCIVEDLDWDALAAHGPEFSGAHIAEVVNYAKMRAIDANSIKDDKLVITNALIKESTSMVSKYFESIKETIGFVSKREMNSKDYD